MTISIIIPAYNAAQWLPEAVLSVQRQTRPPEEIIIVDDGSTDETEELCRSFEGVQYIYQPNAGLPAARNTGIAQSRGKCYLALDADDTLYPHALECLEAKAKESQAGVVYGFVLQRRETPMETRLHSLPRAVGDPPAPAAAMFWWTSISTPGSALVRRGLHESIGGFDESFLHLEDAEYWARCGVSAPFAHCDEIVLDKRYLENSLSTKRANAVWYRLQFQFKFLLWCKHRGVDTDFLQTSPSRIIDHALTRAYRQGNWDLLAPILAQARQEKVFTPWCARATLHLAKMKLTGKSPESQNQYREIYKDWLSTALPK